MHFRTRTITISQEPPIHLSALEAGPSSPKRTLLFVHGLGGWATQWIHQLRFFAESARVIALDLRGHGSSDQPRSRYTMGDLLGDLEIALEDRAVKKPLVLVGHSFGTAIAAQYAAEHADQIDKLVLINPAADFSLRLWARLLLSVPDVLFDGGLRIVNSIRPAFMAPSYVAKTCYRHALRTWSGDQVLSRVRAPTLVITPQFDPLFPQRHVMRVASLISNVEHVTIAAATHMLILTHPTEVNEAILQFLEGRTFVA
jgi:pimeloyl-ACP methyl ester carboxylesterase